MTVADPHAHASTAVLVAGSANLDFVVRAPRIPAPGETVMGHDVRTFPGGKGANQALASARAGGVPTAMLLALGSDSHAVPLEASLRGAGVQLHLERAHDMPTGTAFICVSDAGENAITVAPGANGLLRPQHLPALRGISHLLLQLEIPMDTVIAYATAAQAAGVGVVLNAAPAMALPARLLASLDLLVVNAGELAAITGIAGDVEAGLDALSRMGVPSVAVTLGPDGARLRCGSQDLIQPGFAVTAVDSTAAGDTFCGALVAEIHRGSDWPQALRFACAAAALACTQPGAQTSIPQRQSVLQFLSTQPV